MALSSRSTWAKSGNRVHTDNGTTTPREQFVLAYSLQFIDARIQRLSGFALIAFGDWFLWSRNKECPSTLVAGNGCTHGVSEAAPETARQ